MVHIQKVAFQAQVKQFVTNALRTLARSRQIEAEERAAIRHPLPTLSRQYSDDIEDQAATATLIRDDQIDFLDQERAPEDYRDQFTEDEDNVFRYGDGDEEEEAIGLDKHPPDR